MKFGIYHIVFGILLLASWFGFVGPWAVSSDNDALVIGWFLATFFGAAYIIDFIRRKKNG